MDMQKLIDSMNEQSARQRSDYHLTFGGLIEALKSAPPEATFDSRIKGIGSWRGSYIEIALFTDEAGLHAEKEEFTDYANYKETYDKWASENVITHPTLPTNANELGLLLESLLGFYFVGYKGGHYKIEEYKPLWLTTESSSSGNTAVIGIDKDLRLITKET